MEQILLLAKTDSQGGPMVEQKYPRKFSLAFCTLYLTIGLTSHASATVIWDESLDGDLFVNGSDIGSLELGLNTVLGTGGLFRSGGGVVTADVDSAIFSLTDELFIQSIAATVTDVYGFGSRLQTRYTHVDSPSGLKIFDVEMLSGAEYVNQLPYFETGDYQFFSGGGAARIEDNAARYWDWRIDITTAHRAATVPEPGSLSLLGAGLIGVFALRRRQSRSSSPT
jgi:hypothetical protein